MDLSRSMGYTYRQQLTKFDYSICLAAALCYLMIHQQDPCGLLTFDRRIRNSLAPKTKRKHLYDVLSLLARLRPEGETDIAGSLAQVAALLRHASLVMLFLTSITVAAATVTDGFYLATDGFAVGLVVILGALLLQYRGLALGLGLAIGITALGIANRAQIPPPAVYNHMSSLMNGVMLLSGLAGLGYLLLRYAHINRTEGAQAVSAERLRLAEITSQVAQRISRRMPLQDVLNNAVEQIRIEYPLIYHAQIFMVDDAGQNALLVASTGEIGSLLIQRRHSLPVGSLSVIGQVTSTRKSVIFRAGSPDGIHRRNEFLPDTAVEAAFPHRLGYRKSETFPERLLEHYCGAPLYGVYQGAVLAGNNQNAFFS
jgi:hypothetical protein